MDSNKRTEATESVIVASMDGEPQYTEEIPSEPESPASEVLPEIPVHPLASAFPMLDGEELDALVEDIRENGLRHSIVLDHNGQLIDGRNRLRACQVAGIKPTFTTTDLDPVAYILSENVHRRHLSKGQQAMAYAMAYPEGTNPKGGRGRRNSEVTSEFSSKLVQQARFVLRFAPDLAKKVMDGVGSLDDVHKVASVQKREQEQYDLLRSEVRDRLDSIVSVCARLIADIDSPTTAFLDQEDFVRAVRSGVKELGEYVTRLSDDI